MECCRRVRQKHGDGAKRVTWRECAHNGRFNAGLRYDNNSGSRAVELGNLCSRELHFVRSVERCLLCTDRSVFVWPYVYCCDNNAGILCVAVAM